jgi:hypothetical protein
VLPHDLDAQPPAQRDSELLRLIRRREMPERVAFDDQRAPVWQFLAFD